MSGEAAEPANWVAGRLVAALHTPARGHIAGSVHARLIVLATAAILPMLLLFTAIAYLDYRGERERSGARQLTVTRSMAATVEHEFRAVTASLQTLALAPPLQSGDLAGFKELATRFLSTEPKGAALLLLDSEGRHLVDTQVPPAGQVPVRDAAADAALTSRIFSGRLPLISNLYPHVADGNLIVSTEVPVLRDGRVIYDLSLLLPASRFSDILAEQHPAAGTVLAVFDRSGLIVARLPDPEMLVGHPASPTLLPALLSQDEGVLNASTLDGSPVQLAFSHTEPSGWSVALGVPDADLRAPLMKSLRLAIALGAVGMLASAAVATVIGQRILQPIRALTRFAADPTHAGAGPFGLRELDEVGAALRHSLRDRQAAITALQSLNEQLELRVRQETASRLDAQSQLAQSQRMEALGQLAGGIAHDFNNVLQAVTGGLSLIQRRAADEAGVRRLAGMAADAAARGAAITGRLLTFARRGELAATPIPPGALLENLRDMLAPTIGPGIEVHVEATPDLPNLLADKAQLETVLINLAVNARDAMPAGGTLTLRADTSAGPTPPPTMPAGAYVHLSLNDDGTGMSADVLARASEPFFTTKEPGQGTGLGLAMARGFAEQSGGGLTIISTAGQGTTIHLWFPQARLAAAQPTSPQAPADAELPPMRVLMVDDDAMVREVLAGELEARGFLVTTAADGAAALGLLDAGHDLDLLITDYAMAGLTGLDVITQTRRRRPGLPALLLTGFAEARAEEALSAAQDRLTVLLRKPIGGEDLAQHAARLRRRKK